MTSQRLDTEIAREYDEVAVRNLFAQFVDGWNTGVGEAFAAPFTDEVSFIGFDGTAFTRKEQVAEFHQELFDKWLKGSRLVGDLSVRFLTPDVALLVGHSGTILRGKSDPSKVRDSIQTLTAVRTPDGWRLASFQNTRRRPMTESKGAIVLWLITDLLWRCLPWRKH